MLEHTLREQRTPERIADHKEPHSSEHSCSHRHQPEPHRPERKRQEPHTLEHTPQEQRKPERTPGRTERRSSEHSCCRSRCCRRHCLEQRS